MSDYIKRLAGPYYGEGDKTFTFGFFTYTKEDIYVGTSMSNDEATTILELDVDYSVSLNEDQDATPGGTITLLNETGLKKGEALVIGSDLEPVKNIQLTNYSRFPPEQIDTEFNRIFIILQQLYEITGRTLEVPATSNETPEEMIERLLAAQKTAQAAADAAEDAKDAAQEILDDVQTYGEAATVLEPVKDDIPTLAEIVDQIETVGNNITAVSVVAGDLDVTFKDAIIRLGDLDNDPDPGQTPEVTGGYIKTLAENIADINEIAKNLEDILSLTSEIDKIPGYLEDMDDQVQASAQNAQNALGSANAAANSAQDATTQKNLAKDWAIKLDGKVVEAEVEIDFSAKYWANQAKGSADSASATLTQVTQAGETAVGNIQTAQSTAVQAINSAGSTQIAAVGDAKDSAVAAVSAQQTTSVNAVNAAGTQQTANAKAQADAAAQSASDALTAKTQAEAAKADAVTAKNQAETAAGTATTKAREAAQSAADAGNAKTAALSAQSAAETAQAAAEAAQAAAEEVAGSLGDPLGKEEANNTYRKIVDSYTKTEVDTALNNKLNKTEKAESAKSADSVAWANVSGAPATFPPSAHTHEISEVNGLQVALDEKQPKGSYAEATHTHTVSQITDSGKLATKNEVTASELSEIVTLGDLDNE